MEGKFKKWADKALVTVLNLYPYGNHENRKICENYLPHAYTVLSHKKSFSTTETVAKAYFLHCTAGFMLSQGHWNKAEKLQLQAVKTALKVLGQEHLFTLNSMANLASTYQNQGRWKKAEKLKMQVVEMSERVLGREHPDTLTSMGNLALTYSNQGRWKEAEELGVQMMELKKRVLGGEHPSTLSSMANLASTYENQGRWKGRSMGPHVGSH